MHLLEQLVLKYEGPNSSYQFEESNKQLIEGLTQGIVAFRMKISKIEGQWKLSQNHSIERQSRVIRQLEQSESEDARKISELMKNNIKQNFR